MERIPLSCKNKTPVVKLSPFCIIRKLKDLFYRDMAAFLVNSDYTVAKCKEVKSFLNNTY